MSVAQSASLLLLILLLAGILLLFLPVQRARRARTPTGPISRDDDQYWLGGVIYNNPDDPEWLVPKRFGLGRTLNIGHPMGRLVMVGLLLLVLALALLSSFVPGFSSYGCHPFSGCHL